MSSAISQVNIEDSERKPWRDGIDNKQRDTLEKAEAEQDKSREEIDWDQFDRDRRKWKDITAERSRDDRER